MGLSFRSARFVLSAIARFPNAVLEHSIMRVDRQCYLCFGKWVRPMGRPSPGKRGKRDIGGAGDQLRSMRLGIIFQCDRLSQGLWFQECQFPNTISPSESQMIVRHLDAINCRPVPENPGDIQEVVRPQSTRRRLSLVSPSH
jgi:hypothetical protein